MEGGGGAIEEACFCSVGGGKTVWSTLMYRTLFRKNDAPLEHRVLTYDHKHHTTPHAIN